MSHWTNKIKEENATLKAWIAELSSYVYSSKFCGMDINDKMINKNDIILRINEIETDINLERE